MEDILHHLQTKMPQQNTCIDQNPYVKLSDRPVTNPSLERIATMDWPGFWVPYEFAMKFNLANK